MVQDSLTIIGSIFEERRGGGKIQIQHIRCQEIDKGKKIDGEKDGCHLSDLSCENGSAGLSTLPPPLSTTIK